MSQTKPQISIVIVTCNSRSVLLSCLKALEALSTDLRYQVIIVDNASTDGSAETSAQSCPEAVIIRNERNLGFAAACNQGAERAAGEFLLFLNPDVQIDSDTPVKLLAAFERPEKVGLVSGRLRYPDGRFQATSRKFPTIGNLVFSRGSALYRLIGSSGDRAGRYTLHDADTISAVPAVAATMLMIRKTVFETLGGFDPRFFLFMEDTDLSLRAHRQGYVNLVVPQAGGCHDWGRGSSAGKAARAWHHHRSLWRYFLKHFPNGFTVVFLPLILAVNLFVTLLIPTGKAKGPSCSG